MHKKMTDIIKTNFNFRIYQTILKDTEQKFLVPSNCDLKNSPSLCRVVENYEFFAKVS